MINPDAVSDLRVLMQRVYPAISEIPDIIKLRQVKGAHRLSFQRKDNNLFSIFTGIGMQPDMFFLTPTCSGMEV